MDHWMTRSTALVWTHHVRQGCSQADHIPGIEYPGGHGTLKAAWNQNGTALNWSPSKMPL